MKAIVAFNASGAPSPSLDATFKGYGSKATKRALHAAQHGKCAWCERRTDFSSGPVEHYRPKGGAWRHARGQRPEVVDRAHYWWLAWAWTNLLFACARCNDPGHKANYFPLLPESPAVAGPKAPLPVDGSASFPSVHRELPALLDPAGTENPLDHLEWAPVDTTQPMPEWTWQVIGRSPRGDATIATLILGELAEDVRLHAKTALLPSIEEVNQHRVHRRLKEARSRWDQLLADTFAPDAPLTGFSYYALQWMMPPSLRKAAGLRDPPRPM